MALSPEHRACLDRALKAIAEVEAGPSEDDLIDAPIIDHWRALRSGWRTIVLWSSSGAAIPAAHIIECFSKIIARHDTGAKRVEIMEGIGCWHPVFPANPADVQLWAATGRG